MNGAIHGFIDGAYLLKVAADLGVKRPHPRALILDVCYLSDRGGFEQQNRLQRITFYDAIKTGTAGTAPTEADIEREQYRNDIELMQDTHLGYGIVRRATRKPPEQKGVDTLIAVHMLVGAFTGIFDMAVLVAGDSDFVPVVEEVQRRGVTVIVVADGRCSDHLRRTADRFVEVVPGTNQPHWKDGKVILNGC